MRTHTDEEIITKAFAERKDQSHIIEDKRDVAVDIDDENGITHTYVVTMCKKADTWHPLEISELSSL